MATNTRAMMPAANATPIASALMNSTRGPTTAVTRGMLAEARAGANEGETGKWPVLETGSRSPRSRLASGSFRSDQRWRVLEEQRRRLMSDVGRLDDFDENARQRVELRLRQLRQRQQ